MDSRNELPEPYQEHKRGTDQSGFIAFGANYYWVPGTRRDDVKVLQYAGSLKIFLQHDCLAEYLDFAEKAPGIQRHRFTRALFALSRKLPQAIFAKTLERALRYRIVDLATLQRIAWLCLSQADDVLPEAQVDDDFQQRPAYQAGCLTDLPDLSVFEQLPDEDDNEHKETEDDDRP